MLFEIPIIVVLLQSIPEGFFIVVIGTKLYNIHVDFKRAAIIAMVYGIFAYLFGSSLPSSDFIHYFL